MSTMSEPSPVAFEGVDFGYTDVKILESVTFSVARGEMVAVVGPNGSGKTTLLRLMLGLETPDTGSVRMLGVDPCEARRRVGYMPQHSRYDPSFPVTALAVVLMGRSSGMFGRHSKADRQAALDALADVGLGDRAREPFASLSGGQRQRVLMARALVTDPEILLLDEPTANIDAPTEHRLRDILERCGKRMTVVIVSHDLGFVSELVARVICVNRQVHVHPTSSLAGGEMDDLYGEPVRQIEHGHHCSGGGGACS